MKEILIGVGGLVLCWGHLYRIGSQQKMHAQLTKRWLRKRAPALAIWLLAVAGLSADQAPANANNGEVRFAVAHKHMTSWCYGYLYITANQVRYEVVQPQSDHGHSFAADRASVIAAPWVLFGQPTKDFFNIRVKSQNFRFLWLANEADVNSGGAHRMSPPQSAAPDTLIAAIQNPPTSLPAAAQNATSQTGPAPSSSAAAAAAVGNAQAQPASAPEVPEGDVRFAVAHHHQDASWCYGYLYVTNAQIRYEVTQPESDRTHGFAINRASVTARASAQEAFELVTQSATSQFRWLASEADVNTGRARPANPPEAAPPDIVIKKIQGSTTKTPHVISRPTAEWPRLEPATGAVQNEAEAARQALWRR